VIKIALYLIGIGLSDESDITLKGLDAIKKCDNIFIDNYTSVLIGSSIEKLSVFYGKQVRALSRYELENKADEIIVLPSKNKDNALLVIGDVFSATTHMSIYLSAKQKGIKTKVINNASIINAVGITGLQIYKFGKITSISYPVSKDYSYFHNFSKTDDLPELLNYDLTPYEVLANNLSFGYHTLFLLDIKINEPSPNELKKGLTRSKEESKFFMTVNQALMLLKKLESIANRGIISNDTKCIGVARLGTETKVIKYGTIKELISYDFGKPLHSLIIPGKLHFLEQEALDTCR